VEASGYGHARPKEWGERRSLAAHGLERGPPVAKGQYVFLHHCLIPYGVANVGVVLGVYRHRGLPGHASTTVTLDRHSQCVTSVGSPAA
jgi:hypothetical protein